MNKAFALKLTFEFGSPFVAEAFASGAAMA